MGGEEGSGGSGGNVGGEEGSGGSGRNVGGEGGSGGSGGNVGGEGGSGESGGNVGGEGGSGGNVGGEEGKEQKVVGEVLVVGVEGDIKIVSQVYLHFFFFIIILYLCVHFQNISTIYQSSIHRGKMLFYLKGRCKRGGNCPFSHKHKLMSQISLYI